MVILKGIVCRDGEGAGLKHFSRRMNEYPKVFERATGEKLFPGTLNVNVGEAIKIQEHFRIQGKELRTSSSKCAASTGSGLTASARSTPWETADMGTTFSKLVVTEKFQTSHQERKWKSRSSDRHNLRRG